MAEINGRANSFSGIPNLTGCILSSLNDYIVLFNGSGHSIYSNRVLSPLFNSNKRPSRHGNFHGSLSSASKLSGDLAGDRGLSSDIHADADADIPDDNEMSILLDVECPDLITDLKYALSQGAAFSGQSLTRRSIIFSDVYAHGVIVDYTLSPLSMEAESLQELIEDSYAILLSLRITPPALSMKAALGQLLDAANHTLLYPPADAVEFGAMTSNSGSIIRNGVMSSGTVNGNSSSSFKAGTFGYEFELTMTDKVDLIRRVLDEILVTLIPRSHKIVDGVTGATTDGITLPSTDPATASSTPQRQALMSIGASGFDLSGSETPDLADITQWDFDVFTMVKKSALAGVMWRLVDSLGITSELKMSSSVLCGFIHGTWGVAVRACVCTDGCVTV